MKKAYSKPDIFFEDFSLSTNIAAGCVLIAERQDGKFGVLWGGMYIFTGDCTDNVKTETWGTICYHIPTPGNNAFSS